MDTESFFFPWKQYFFVLTDVGMMYFDNPTVINLLENVWLFNPLLEKESQRIYSNLRGESYWEL